MYKFIPAALGSYAHIRADKRIVAVFQRSIPTQEQGDKMAAALDPANAIVPLVLLEDLLKGAQAMGWTSGDKIRELLK